MASNANPLIIFLPLILSLVSSSSSQSTSFVDGPSKLVDYAEPEWFLANIPFLEVPDAAIEAVYYYRWSSLKRHLRYTTPGAGYIVTEFVHKVGYSQKFDTINAAAGHHIDEAKWLRDSRYVKDYINVWAREGGGNQQYSEWIADAAFNAYLLNGDAAFIQSQQEGLVTNFLGWDHKFEPDLNLYFLSPHDDAMEHSASSEQTDDPYHGGLGYRPSFNSEMYANAVAIGKIARMNGDLVTATDFEGRAARIRAAILDHLWDNDRKFFYHVYREDNPSLDLLDTREEIGFFPWRWNVPPQNDDQFQLAWDQLFNPDGFNTAYGPTTCEVRSQWYDGNQTSQCCWWNGNSWPYSTGHTLRALASQVKNYQPSLVTVDDFVSMLNKYARTQYKNGSPYVAECHSPSRDLWVCDGRNHSEHYAHSTYNDNVLSDLIGIEPQADNSFQVNPLIPSNWSWFVAENIPYHGHNLTVLWDRDGTKYNSPAGAGMSIWLNGVVVANQSNMGLMKVTIPPPNPEGSYPTGYQRLENYASNVNGFGYPVASASYSTSTDSSAWQAVDGRVFYDFIPSNRWSNYGNDITATDWFALDFGPGRFKTVDQVKLYIYSDYVNNEGGVDCPIYTEVQYFNTTLQTWLAVPRQVLTPSVCVPNSVWTVDFAPVTTQRLRVLFSNNEEQGTFVGISEIEVWGAWPQTGQGVYEAEDGYLGGLEIKASPSASGGSYVGLYDSDGDNTYLEFTGVWADAPGNYSVSLAYTNGGVGGVRLRLEVNNVHEIQVTLPTTSTGWGEFDPEGAVLIQVPLWRGNNVLIFRPLDENSVELDRIRVQ